MAKKQPSYAEALQELQEIMQKIEREGTGIDELLKDVKKAAELIKYCRKGLYEIDEEIKAVLDTIE